MRLRLLCFLFIFFFAVALFAQVLHETVLVDLVDLYLTATDKKGHFITDLKADELFVKENGIPQQIQRFGQFAGEGNDIPVLLALVMDNSASMDDQIGELRKIDLSRQVAELLIGQLGPLDRMMLVYFKDEPFHTGVTSDHHAVTKLLNDIRPIWWQTALFDSISSAVQELNRNPGRKILLLCSDGRDNMSQTTFDQVVKLATNSPDLTIVVLGVGATNQVHGLRGRVQNVPNVPWLRGKEYLQNLADKTAGFAYFPESMKDAEKVLELLKGFIRSQYYLVYRSKNPKQDGSWRRIEITSKRKDIILHYRNGYYANKPRSS